MKNKENNPHFVQVNDFFGEVKDYIEQYKQCFMGVDTAKTERSKLFDLQKQINDVDYKISQSELKLKKQLDEDLRKKKDELEQKTYTRFNEVEQERAKVQLSLEKKQVYEQQLDSVIN